MKGESERNEKWDLETERKGDWGESNREKDRLI